MKNKWAVLPLLGILSTAIVLYGHHSIWRRSGDHRKPIAYPQRAETSATHHEEARWFQFWIHRRTEESHATIDHEPHTPTHDCVDCLHLGNSLAGNPSV